VLLPITTHFVLIGYVQYPDALIAGHLAVIGPALKLLSSLVINTGSIVFSTRSAGAIALIG